jgi:hypothetical protein
VKLQKEFPKEKPPAKNAPATRKAILNLCFFFAAGARQLLVRIDLSCFDS